MLVGRNRRACLRRRNESGSLFSLVSDPPKPAAAPLISVCVIVRDERKNLGACLDSLRGWPGEIIVVDTGSTDGTPEFARQRGACVIEARWENDFSRARNLGLAAARGRWILILDADEYLRAPDRAALVALAQAGAAAPGGPATAYTLQQKSSTDGGRTGMLARQVRLFPNRADIRYEWPIHEQVVMSLQRAGVPIAHAPVEIVHTGYMDPARNREKQRRNLTILQTQVAAGREVLPMTFFLLGGAHLDLGEYELALGGYRECERREPGDTELRRGAQVRIATCLLRLQRPAEALAGLPAAPAAAWHPELLTMRGEIAVALGHPDEARPWFERVLAGTNRPFVPACDLMAEKIRAALFLGTYWKDHGKPAVGLAVLREALACQQGGGDFTLARLREIYRQHQLPEDGQN